MPTHEHAWKDTAVTHFQRWADHYDRDIINTLLFEPCYRRVLCQLRHWSRRGLENIRMLDVGCGTGSLAVQCLRRHSQVESVVGLDMSENMIAKARDKAERLRLDGRVCFVIGDAEQLQFEDNSFDVVTCCNSFHHYPHQDRAVAEMFRVLAPGGRIILIDGCRDDPVGYFIFDVCVARAEQHVHHCSAERFAGLLTGVGFDRIKQQVFGFCPPAVMNVGHAQKQETNRPDPTPLRTGDYACRHQKISKSEHDSAQSSTLTD